MKPKRTQRQPGAQWRGKAVSTSDKTTLNPAKQKSSLPSSARVKPFAGKVFYLDLPSNRTAETLERDIKELGGTVEKFFSKDIRYLVSNKREARYVHCLRHDSPVPSPDSGPSSPHPRSVQRHPGSHGENIKSKNQSQTEMQIATSRGKSLVERVVKEQERVQINKILSNALEWGVKILYIDDVIAYVNKKKKATDSQVSVTAPVKTHVKAESTSKLGLQKHKAGNIRKPFIKVEDSSRHYRPIFLAMQSVPELSLTTQAPCSPFCPEDKDLPGNKQRGHGCVKATAVDVKGQVRKKSKDKKRSGFCECCMLKFDNLSLHLKGERHKTFSKSRKYFVVDQLISTLSCNFIPASATTKRPKCSIASKAETPPEATPQGADTSTLSHLKSHVKTTSPSDSPPPSQTRKEQRNRYTYSLSSKQKYLARKRPCGQKSPTSGAQDADKEQVPRSDMKTAPSSDDVFSILLSGVCHVDPPDQRPHKHADDSTSRVADASSRRNHREETQLNTDATPLEAVPDKNVFPDKETEVKLPEKEEEESLSEKTSPVQKFKRKIRVYKHKRRKVDVNVESVDSIFKVWECFQSSDDMDLEFRGFEDEDLT
ncbi:unnamed protein product [Ophioblennius macclurei]